IPHSSLRLRVDKKLSSFKRIRFTRKSALATVSLTLVCRSVVFESHDSKNSLLRLSISIVSTSRSEMTKGRTFRLWGEMGVITKLLESGRMIGPPQLNE